MKFKAIVSIACIFVLIISLCSISYAEPETRKITDMAGNEVEIPVNLTSIACMSATCETALVAMGQADKMAYTSTFAQGDFTLTKKLFPALADVPQIKGGLTNEEMLARGIQVVFVKSKGNAERLKAAGLTPFYLEFNNIEQTKESIRLLGEIFNVNEIANQYISYIDKFIPLIQERLADIPAEQNTTLYAPLLRSSSDTIFNTYDPSHITTEVFDLCHGYVVTKDIAFTDNNGILTEEALLRNNPEVIFLCGFYREKGYEELTNGQYDGVLQAVDNHSIYYFPLGMYDWSAGGFELGISSLWVAKTLYPDRFADIDFNALAKEYYLNTTGVELSDEDISYIFQ